MADHMVVSSREKWRGLRNKRFSKTQQKCFSQVRPTPDNELSATQYHNIRLVRELVLLGWPDVNRVAAADIPCEEGNLSTAGLYALDTRDIFLDKDLLNKATDALGTIVHEIGHHISKAEDGTQKHYDGMMQAAVKVDELLKSPRLVPLLKEVVL